jgi:Uma2 family endonuclease
MIAPIESNESRRTTEDRIHGREETTMSTLTTTRPTTLQMGEAPIHRITVDEYEAMIEAGIYTDDDKLELIEGMLVEKTTKTGRHTAGSGKSWRVLDRALPAGWHARGDAPVRLPGRDSEPEPDVSVARGVVDDYLDRAPEPTDLALVVEVSVSSLAKDRALAHTYLAAGIPAYWLLDVVGRRLEVYTTDPSHPEVIAEDGHADLVLDGQVVARIAVADLLPGRGD